MTDRLIRSSTLALVIASLGVFPACESDTTKAPEQLTSASSELTTGLQPGDVVVTCLNSATDEVQINTLVPLDINSDLKFTDNEWFGSGFVDFGETTDYAIPVTTALPAGGHILFIPGGGAAATGGISSGPEQLFIYQGLIAPEAGAPAFSLLWGLQIVNTANWPTSVDGGALPNNVSTLPPALADPNNIALVSAGTTFYAYTGPTTGTKAQLKLALHTVANWTGPNAVDGGAPTCPGNFTVLPDVDAGTDGGGTGADAGTGGTPGTDAGTGGAPGTDAGTDVRPDAGNDAGTATDVRPDAGNDTGTVTDVRPDAGNDTGGTGTDARPDAGNDVRADAGNDVRDAGPTPVVDAGKDSVANPGGGGGCSCSTAVGRDGMGAGAWLLAVAGIVLSIRRRKR